MNEIIKEIYMRLIPAQTRSYLYTTNSLVNVMVETIIEKYGGKI